MLTEFSMLMKLISLIKMCLNNTNSEVLEGKDLSDEFYIQNGQKKRDALLSWLFRIGSDYASGKVQEQQRGGTEWVQIKFWSILVMSIYCMRI